MASAKSWSSLSLTLLLLLAGRHFHPTSAATCVQDQNCMLPKCFCPTFQHPMGAQNIPQIVYFGFDDAVQPQVSGYYKELFNGVRKNPNGCPITMSLFVSNEYTLYELVNEYYKDGMEIGVHSVTHQDINTAAKLQKEASEQKQNIVNKGKVPPSEVRGWRSPNLVTAGDSQPTVLKDLNFTYDISLTYSTDDNYPFPFTLDYGYPYPCPISPCPNPTASHKGFWEVMIHALRDPDTGIVCGYVDSCRPDGEDAALEYLWSNFLKVYENTRAPFGLNMHAAWFATPEYMSATARFIDQLLETPDVYIVNVHQMLEWMQNPVPASQAKTFAPWGCGRTPQAAPETEEHKIRESSHKPPMTTEKPQSSPAEQPFGSRLRPQGNAREDNKDINSSRTNLNPLFNWYRRSQSSPWEWAHLKPAESATARPTRATTTLREQRFFKQALDLSRPNASDCVQGINCKLPNCYCRTENPPLNLAIRDIPQIVYLAVDTEIDGRTFAPLLQLFTESRKNPNGCPISGTIFIPSTGNYPPYVEVLKTKGLHMGIRGVTYSEHLTGDAMKQRVQEEISRIRYKMDDSYGWRGFASFAPTDDIFQTLQASNAVFDSSIITSASDNLWPYTLDFGLLDECAVNPTRCPSGRYPGLWEVPLKPLNLDDESRTCVFPDACPGVMDTDEQVYEVLKANFQSHYQGNKAPFGINLHSTWLTNGHQQEKLRGLMRFIDDILRANDNVFVVSVEQMLEWIKSPVKSAQNFPC